jgi:hypothetical protein
VGLAKNHCGLVMVSVRWIGKSDQKSLTEEATAVNVMKALCVSMENPALQCLFNFQAAGCERS